MISLNKSRQKALSLRTSGVVYFRQTGKASSDYEVIDAQTGVKRGAKSRPPAA